MAGTTQNIVRIQLGESKQRCPAHYVRKRADADGFRLVEHAYSSESEQIETLHWLKSALLCEYNTQEMHDDRILRCKINGRTLGNMLKNPDRWGLKED